MDRVRERKALDETIGQRGWSRATRKCARSRQRLTSGLELHVVSEGGGDGGRRELEAGDAGRLEQGLSSVVQALDLLLDHQTQLVGDAGRDLLHGRIEVQRPCRSAAGAGGRPDNRARSRRRAGCRPSARGAAARRNRASPCGRSRASTSAETRSADRKSSGRSTAHRLAWRSCWAARIGWRSSTRSRRGDRCR